MAVIRFDKEKGWLEATVTRSGGGGAVTVPRDWVGRKVRVQIIEDEEKDGE